MAMKSLTFWKLALVLGAILPATGCVAAAAAGAASGIYVTSRGAESLVEAPIDQATARAEAVMDELDIAKDAESSENGGANQELKGKKGDLDVTIKLDRQDESTTKVEVTARKNLAEWDKDYAREVLSRIVQKG